MRRACLPVFALCITAASWPSAASSIAPADLNRLELRQYWQTNIPLGGDELVASAVLVDDNLYLMTTANRAYAIHAGTGIIRWSTEITSPGETVRGPTHSQRYAVFTTSTGVRLFDRRTGDMATEHRSIKGVIVEVRGDIADVNVGEEHGVQSGTLLNVRAANAVGDSKPKARLRLRSIHPRDGTGRCSDFDPGNPPRAGDRVEAEVDIPLRQVVAPFSPSSPAVADVDSVYFGAANGRLYALTIIGGFRRFELLTPNGISATPRLIDNMLYTAGQDGVVRAIRTREHTRAWEFHTEAAIFADPLVTADRVVVASSDRSMYSIDRASGARRWRARFDSELLHEPQVAGDTVFIPVAHEGLHAINYASGEQRWRYADAVAWLTRAEGTDYLLTGSESDDGRSRTATGIVRVESVDGRRLESAAIGGVDFVMGSADPAAIIFADRLGHVSCARSKSAEHLRPQELADVLRNDAAHAALTEAAGKPKRPVAPPQKPTDLFSNRSSVPPAVGIGLVPTSEPASEEGTAASKPATTEAAPAEEEESGDDSAGDEETPDEESANDNSGGGGF